LGGFASNRLRLPKRRPGANLLVRDETPQGQPGVTKNFHSGLTLDSLSPVLFIRVRRTFLDEFPHMAEGIEFIDIALMERRSLETALAQLVAKFNRQPNSELARMIRGINAEIIQRRTAGILNQSDERYAGNGEP
jgi:hypothetical protein